MQLGKFILANEDRLARESKEQTKTRTAAAPEMARNALPHGVIQILKAVADEMDQRRTPGEQNAKEKGRQRLPGAGPAIAAGIVGGVFGASLSVAHPALRSSTPSVASVPVIIKPGTPILLINNGEAHASVRVDRNGLILLNFATRTGRNQIALGVLGASKLEVGVFDSAGKAKVGIEVPMKDSGQVRTLLLDKHNTPPSANTRSTS